MQQNAQLKGRAGFSLLEMLVAVTVLVVIVLIASMVFQQTQTAWTAGSRRAAAETALRGIMGILERDLTHAVDATQFGATIGGQQSFGANGFTFVTLDGTNRMAQLVDYTFGGGNLTRYTQQIIASGAGSWTLGPQIPSPATPLNEGFSMPTSGFSVRFYDMNNALQFSMSTLPSRVEVTAQISLSTPYISLSGFSYGPLSVETYTTTGDHHNDSLVVNP